MDPEDPLNPGFALFPAMGTLRNDMGAYGGPGTLNWVITGIAGETLWEAIPGQFKLLQNYPNPFNPSTTIGYQLQDISEVTIEVFDITGRKVATLVNKKQEPGYYRVRFNASNLASGIYLYRLKTENNVGVKKMVIIK
jgi:hypothetical protein